MRLTRLLIGLLVAGLLVFTSRALAQARVPSEEKGTAADGPKRSAKQPTLDEIIAAAVRANPDVAIAQAEVQLAEAKLNAVKIEAAQKVTAMKAALDDAELQVAQAEKQVDQARDLHNSTEQEVAEITQRHSAGRAATSEVERIRQKALAARTQRLEAEKELKKAQLQFARLKADWDRQAERAIASQLTEGRMTVIGDKAVARGLNWLRQSDTRLNLNSTSEAALALRLWTGDSQATIPQARLEVKPGSPVEQLRVALDKQVKLDRGRVTVNAALDRLLQAASLTIRVKIPRALWDPRDKHPQELSIDLSAAEMPLGSWLQLISDEVSDDYRIMKRHDFYVRDYGLLLTTPEAAPPGAVPLSVFWKEVHLSSGPAKSSKTP